MKINYLKIKIFLLFTLVLISCDTLDKEPVDRYSDAVVWSDINLADVYLQRAYFNLYHGFDSSMGAEAFTDIDFFKFDRGVSTYLLGNVNPDNLGAFNNGRMRGHDWALWNNIQLINVFIDRIDNLAESYSPIEQENIKERADILKGEAYFLRAYCIHNLARLWGGMPIKDGAWSLEDDFYIERLSFEETVNAIVDDCDKAASLLKTKDEMGLGRASKGAALALKSRILLFAASDLTADGNAKSKYVGYENPNRTALWTAARDAAKAVIDLNDFKLSDFGAPNLEAVSENYFGFFKQKTLENDEIIFGRTFLSDLGDRHRWNQITGPNGINNWGAHNATQALIDSYEMEDGSSFFDHFYVDNEGFYKNKGNTKYKDSNLYKYREPRFYATVLYDSCIWQPRFTNLEERDPVGIYDRRTRVVISGGEEISKVYGIDTSQGPIENWNASETGYLQKKYMDNEVVGMNEYNTNVYIYMRYAEVILNYAEACLELGDEKTASTYINFIRNRAGLPDFTGDITQALRKERKVELAFEDLRLYDIRRWKILKEVLTNAQGIDIIETKDLDKKITTTTYQLINVQDRKPSDQMYWLPIPTVEIKKAPQLVQNPGY